MNQIIINLVNNAIKYTDIGEISIDLQKTNGLMELSVKDTGIGIKKEDIMKLFKPFSRILDEAEYKEGTGLGLHLSQKLAQLLNGKISVESEFGKGSTFILSINTESEN
jgi:protein-histidine pros-kinase